VKTAESDGCTIYTKATLGGTSLYKGQTPPTLGKTCGWGWIAQVLGGLRWGGQRQGSSNTVVVKPVVPARATAIRATQRDVIQARPM
jgi:serine acetyltransferase